MNKISQDIPPAILFIFDKVFRDIPDPTPSWKKSLDILTMKDQNMQFILMNGSRVQAT